MAASHSTAVIEVQSALRGDVASDNLPDSDQDFLPVKAEGHILELIVRQLVSFRGQGRR